MFETRVASKTFYIAAKVSDNDLNEVVDLSDELESNGHKNLYKWWERQSEIQKPYLEHRESNIVVAQAMGEAASRADVVLLFAHDNLLGASTELGIAIESAKGRALDPKEIYVIYEEGVRQSIFYCHPSVIAVEGISAIRNQPWYKFKSTVE